jgi:microsomal epoxide hydrolase
MAPLTSFSIDVPDSVLADLRTRLGCVRWPDEVAGGGWRQGASLDYMRSLIAYWRDQYDWRVREARLNRFAQFRTRVGEVDVHFIQEVGEGASPYPLLLSHGWPGSIVEFQELIPRLTRPSAFGASAQDAFTVIAPSLPGFGFSFAPGQRLGANEIADLFVRLMREVLGFERFAAHGHDWGAYISTRLGFAHAQHVLGIHVTLLAAPREPVDTAGLSPDEQRYNDQLRHWLREETGYSLQQATRPQTLSYGLTDSPAGLAAWIVEKFRAWSDCGEELEAVFPRDLLLDNIMVYWVTGAINSSFWPYYARHHGQVMFSPGERVQVPTGYAEYPKEILTPPRSLAERTYPDIRRWTTMPRGGHFAALEDPDGLAYEIREFFRPLRAERGEA